jgi:hypothetical protein
MLIRVAEDSLDKLAEVVGEESEYLRVGKCLRCGYWLRGLTERRCPECGKRFDPRDPRTMWLPQEVLPAELKKMPLLSLVLWENVIGDAICWVILAVLTSRVMCLFVLAVLVAMVLMGMAWRRRARQPDAGRTRHWRKWVVGLWVMALPLMLRRNVCPHGTTVGFGSVGIMYSEYGGPCNNSPLHGGSHISGHWYWANLED